jgi:hypothetical protein
MSEEKRSAALLTDQIVLQRITGQNDASSTIERIRDAKRIHAVQLTVFEWISMPSPHRPDDFLYDDLRHKSPDPFAIVRYEYLQ